MTPIDHFGEVAIIYSCRRTATVLSGNYDTVALLTQDSFRSLVSEYPDYLKLLKAHIFKYKDPMKQFLLRTINRVSYFKKISKDA